MAEEVGDGRPGDEPTWADGTKYTEPKDKEPAPKIISPLQQVPVMRYDLGKMAIGLEAAVYKAQAEDLVDAYREGKGARVSSAFTLKLETALEALQPYLEAEGVGGYERLSE